MIFPTLIAVVTIASLARLAGAFLEKYKRRSFVPEAVRLALTLLVLLGIRGMAATGGYNLESVLGLMVNHDPSLTILWAYKLAFLLVLVSVIYAAIRMLACPGGVRRLVRFSTALGFSLFALAVFNMLQLTPYDEGKAPFQASTSRKDAVSVVFQAEKSKAPRRVVWVIFDELDYQLVFGDSVRQSPQGLENFQHLAENGLSARQALSPSNATITSIPSLLMGTQTAGAKFLGTANYRMITLTGKPLQFSQAESIFGRLHENGQSFSILGFYHPYCSIFIGASLCHTHSLWFDGWYTGLIDWAPGTLLAQTLSDPMSLISAEQQSKPPAFLQGTGDALTFLHFNVPHLPAFYAFKHYGQTASADYRVQYAANLRLADEMLGQIIKALERISADQDVLLIVSGDHGFRAVMKTPDEPRPVPWIAWRVGARDGQTIVAPISTVHTAALIEDFLGGKVSSQSGIAGWWRDKPVLPRLAILNDHAD